jgi:type I restriction enzyme S subunit
MSAALHTERLSDVAELNPRLVESLENDTLVSFVPMSAVTAETASTTSGEERQYRDVSKGYTPFLNGDVLVAKITPCFENGKIAQARLTHRFGFGSTEFHVVRPRAGRADSRYLLHFLRQQNIRVAGERRMTGSAGQRRVPEKFLAELEIGIPPLSEQRRIAEVLDRAEALRAKRRAALTQLDTLTQSIFLDLFGDPVTNPKGWKIEELGSFAERITKGESPKWQGFEYQDDGALFVTSENVRLGAIDLSAPKFVPLEFNSKLSRSELRLGDLLVNLVGASIGRSCIFPGYDRPANINQAVAVVTIDKSRLDHVFLSGLLVSERGQQLLLNNRVEGARANISLTDLRELRVPVPPVPLQHEFARRIAAVDKLKSAHRASLAKLDALFASLQHRAFRGEL